MGCKQRRSTSHRGGGREDHDLGANAPKRRRLSSCDTQKPVPIHHDQHLSRSPTPLDDFEVATLRTSWTSALPPSANIDFNHIPRPQISQVTGTILQPHLPGPSGLGEFEDIDIDKEFADFEEKDSGCSGADYDQYSLQDSDEEAMAKLLYAASAPEPLDPPSSIVRAHDRDSRSADEFDCKLQYSPPNSGSPFKASQDEQTPEEEVDWEHILRQAVDDAEKDFEKLPHTASPRSTKVREERQKNGPLGRTVQTATPLTQFATSTSVGGDMLLRPYKTFFHLEELLNAKEQMFKNQPDAIFELFARVVYSSRENFYQKQYFQMGDLFKETPPYLPGVLLG